MYSPGDLACVHVLAVYPFQPSCTCFACCLRLSFTDSGSTLFHSAAMQRNTSAPPFSTWWTCKVHNLSLHIVFFPLTRFKFHWPAGDADPLRDELALSTPAGSNQLLISFHLHNSTKLIEAPEAKLQEGQITTHQYELYVDVPVVLLLENYYINLKKEWKHVSC